MAASPSRFHAANALAKPSGQFWPWYRTISHAPGRDPRASAEQSVERICASGLTTRPVAAIVGSGAVGEAELMVLAAADNAVGEAELMVLAAADKASEIDHLLPLCAPLNRDWRRVLAATKCAWLTRLDE